MPLGLGIGRLVFRDAVLAGQPTHRRSHAHRVCIALELVKVLALLIGGTMLLSIGG